MKNLFDMESGFNDDDGSAERAENDGNTENGENTKNDREWW